MESFKQKHPESPKSPKSQHSRGWIWIRPSRTTFGYKCLFPVLCVYNYIVVILFWQIGHIRKWAHPPGNIYQESLTTGWFVLALRGTATMVPGCAWVQWTVGSSGFSAYARARRVKWEKGKCKWSKLLIGEDEESRFLLQSLRESWIVMLGVTA